VPGPPTTRAAARRSAVTLEVFNEITRHRQAQQLRARKGSRPTFEYSARLAELTRVAGSIETLGREAEAIETRPCSTVRPGDADPAAWAPGARRPSGPGPRRSWRCTGSSIRTRIRTLSSSPSGPVSSSRWPQPIARWRREAAPGRLWQFVDEADDRPPKARRVERPGEFLASPRGGVVGVRLEFRWDDAHARLAPEPGLHRFHDHGRVDSCLVESTDLAVTAYRTPEGIGRPGSIDGNPDGSTAGTSVGWTRWT